MTPEPRRTARLVGTPPVEADWPDWRALLLDPRVAATIGGVPSADEARARFDAAIHHWAEHGFGQWAWLLDPTPTAATRHGYPLFGPR